MNMCFKGKEIDQISAMASPKQKITTAQQQEQNGGREVGGGRQGSNGQDHNEYCYTKDATCSNTTESISSLTSNRSDNCSPDSKSFPTRTQRTNLWDTCAKWVSRTVFPSPASKLLYSTSFNANAVLTSARYMRTAELW